MPTEDSASAPRPERDELAEAFEQFGYDDPMLDPDGLLLIVAGAHMRAEMFDRPTAYALRRHARAWIARRLHADDPHVTPVCPVVCTDVWYLNQPALRGRPTICVGGPEVNALSAMLVPRLPCVYSVQDSLAVHLDLTHTDLVACLWGERPHATASAASVFIQRYLDGFLEAACRVVA